MRYFLLFVYVCCFSTALAQNDSIISLEAIEIKSVSLVEKKAGFEVQHIDSLAMESFATSDLGRLLAYRTPVFLKFYSVSGLATPSFRGTSAGHTQVFWQGIPLNSPTLGQVDFSLFPIGLLDEIDVHYGAASLRYGEGGFGGGISLQHQQKRDAPFSLNWIQSYGSFQTLQQLLKTSYSLHSDNKIRGVSRLFFKSAKNNYPYRYNNEVFRRERAKTNQKGIVQEFYFFPRQNHQFSINVWAQQADRELPPPITVAINEETQKDFSLRNVLNYEFKQKNLKIKASAAHLYDRIRYENLVADLKSTTTTQSYHALAELSYLFSEKVLIQTGFRARYDNAQTDGYEQAHTQSQQSAFASLEYTLLSFLELNFLGRQVFLNGQTEAFLPSLGMNLTYQKWLLKANVARNLRIPTLNDRYWFPVGNPDLRNEKGWNGEINLNYKVLKTEKLNLSLSSLYFWAKIQDWILWSPAVAGYWRPENLRDVLSQGTENSISFQFKNSNLHIETSFSYTYTNSKNLEPIRDLDESAGKQLIYTPFHQQKSFVFMRYKSNFLRTEQQYVGKRFTTTTNTQFLPAYFLLNFSIGREWKYKKIKLISEINVQNLFDFQYQSMAFYPMVGRSGEVVLKLGI